MTGRRTVVFHPGIQRQLSRLPEESGGLALPSPETQRLCLRNRRHRQKGHHQWSLRQVCGRRFPQEAGGAAVLCGHGSLWRGWGGLCPDQGRICLRQAGAVRLRQGASGSPMPGLRGVLRLGAAGAVSATPEPVPLSRSRAELTYQRAGKLGGAYRRRPLSVAKCKPTVSSWLPRPLLHFIPLCYTAPHGKPQHFFEHFSLGPPLLPVRGSRL